MLILKCLQILPKGEKFVTKDNCVDDLLLFYEHFSHPNLLLLNIVKLFFFSLQKIFSLVYPAKY